MTFNRKYATLPDLDSAPDIYETPSLTDDNSTAATHTARSESQASDYQDFAEDGGISRAHLQTNEARSRFEPARIDARDVDFSDRVTGKRKSYKTSSRRLEEDEGSDEDGEDDGEGLERKIARLRREIEEVRETVGKSKAEGKKANNGEDKDQVEALSRMLEETGSSNGDIQARGRTASARLAQALSTPLKTSPSSTETQPQPSSLPAGVQNGAPTYTVTYHPTTASSHALAKAAAFDSRLTALETALGLPPLTSAPTPLAILPTLSTLERQLTLLTTSTPSSLDAISRRVRTLTQEAEKLAEIRKVSEEAAETDERLNDGSTAKINALYGTLPTIENLAPLLPGLLERLRSLRALHAEAATAGERMDEAMRRQEDMGKEIARWKEGVEELEAAIGRAEEAGMRNLKTVEGWVRELENKVADLES